MSGLSNKFWVSTTDDGMVKVMPVAAPAGTRKLTVGEAQDLIHALESAIESAIETIADILATSERE